MQTVRVKRRSKNDKKNTSAVWVCAERKRRKKQQREPHYSKLWCMRAQRGEQIKIKKDKSKSLRMSKQKKKKKKKTGFGMTPESQDREREAMSCV